MLAVACGDDGNTSGIPNECNPLGGRGLPAAVAVVDLPRGRIRRRRPGSGWRSRSTAMPTNDDGITVDPAPFNRWDGFSADRPDARAFPTGVSADRACRRSRTPTSRSRRTRRSCWSTSTPASARRSSPRSIRTRSTIAKRALIIRPLARLAPKRATRSRSARRSRPPTAASCRRRPRSRRCAPARTSATRGSPRSRSAAPAIFDALETARRRPRRPRARVGLRHRVRRVPALAT